MITYIIIKINANAELKHKIYKVFVQRAHSAPTAHNVPTARCLTRYANAKPRRLFWGYSK